MRQDKAIQFLKHARYYADVFSKDRSTKVGAFFIDPQDFTELAQGYNGMPRGVNEDIPARHERPLKYSYFEHAERNAIYNRARSRLQGSWVVSTETPSLSCVRALLAVGVQKVYFSVKEPATPEWEIAKALGKEAGLTMVFLEAGADPSTVPQDRETRKIEQISQVTRNYGQVLSKDPQGGAAMFVTPRDFTPLTRGYAGMPRGADDSRTERYVGELRDMWVESAIRNAIYNAVRPELKGSVALVTATTCVECARAIAAVGAKQVFYVEPDAEFNQRWGASLAEALALLKELDVETAAVPATEI